MGTKKKRKPEGESPKAIQGLVDLLVVWSAVAEPKGTRQAIKQLRQDTIAAIERAQPFLDRLGQF